MIGRSAAGILKTDNLNKQICNAQTPQIPIRLQNLHTTGLLDTGSSKSYVNEDVLMLLQASDKRLRIQNINQSCVMANACPVTISKAFNIKVSINNFSWMHTFLVIHSLAFPCVLGTDFMIKTGLQLNFDQSRLLFDFKPERILLIQDNLPSNCKLTVSQEMPVLNHISADKRIKLLEIIECFPDVLTKKLGLTDQGYCHLQLKDSKPCRSPPYMLAPPKLEVLRTHVNELLAAGVIKQSISDYSSPCFLVPKKDGSKRLVVDYRKVNAKVVFDTFPLPTIESALMNFGGAQFFTILDLNAAYHQVPLTPESQKYTTFTTPFGSYSYTRLPFGLTVGSQVLSRILANVFSEASWKFIFLYLDDLLIFSKSFPEHLEHVTFVLNKLREAKFTVNPEKASFCAAEIPYLGYLISPAGIRVNPDRIRPILDYPRPKTVRQVRRFLGMVGFYARFIPGMSQISEPLNSLKRKGCKFKWEAQQQNAFEVLKDCLCNPPLLHSPNFNEQFTLQTDASDKALGAVLQQSVNGTLVPIAYASRLLSTTEQKGTTYERESLAAVWACEKFSKFLEHSHFILQTDNQALSWLRAQAHSLGKVGRWLYRLSAFSFEVQHISASDNPVADSLSRLFCEEPTPTIAAILPDYPLSFTTIREHQQQDDKCKALFNQLEQGIQVPNYLIHQGLLMFKPPRKTQKRVVAPQAIQPMLLKYFHSSILGGHLGITKTLHKMAQNFYWPKMIDSVSKHVRSCVDCQLAKPSPNTHVGFLASHPPTRPWECIHIDFVGPIVKSTKGHIGLLSIIDSFSKFVFLFPVKRIAADITVSLLVNQVFSSFGPPKTLVSDNHSIFLSKLFHDMCFSWGIRHSRTSPYRPHSSHIERFHRNLKSSLIIFSNANHTCWDFFLPYIQSAFNSSWHSATRCTPSSLFLGREISHPLLLAWNIDLDDNAFLQPADMEKRWVAAFNALKQANLRGAKYYNKLRVPSSFKVDDWVLLQSHTLSNAAAKISSKLSQRWCGPYVIASFLSPVTVLLRMPLGGAPFRQAHVSQLKNYVNPDA